MGLGANEPSRTWASAARAHRHTTIRKSNAPEAQFSIGVLAPSGTPVDIIEQIAHATRTAVAEPAYKQMLIAAGIEPSIDSNPEKFRRSLAADVDLWAPVVKNLGLKID